MIKISLLALSFISFSTFAANSVQFYTIRTSEPYTSNELALECGDDMAGAAAKLSEISARLSPGVPDALTVTSAHGRRSISSGSSRVPRTSYEYYCVLKFSTNDPSLSIDSYTATRFTHIGRGNWDTACQPAYENALANINSPVSMYWKFWTLIQGRSCDVDTVEIKKK